MKITAPFNLIALLFVLGFSVGCGDSPLRQQNSSEDSKSVKEVPPSDTLPENKPGKTEGFQQKVIDRYESLIETDSLHTVMDNNIVIFDTAKNRIYADTTLYSFAELHFYKIKYEDFLTPVNTNKKIDPEKVKDSRPALPDHFKICSTTDFYKRTEKFNEGDVHLTISKAIFENQSYYVQVLLLFKASGFFHFRVETIKFDQAGEIVNTCYENVQQVAMADIAIFLKNYLKM